MEWYNGNKIGEDLAFVEDSARAEYMIKEKWPDHLSKDYSVRMKFDIRPETSGLHHLSIITTGSAKVYIDDELVHTREQETDLIAESFYFFKSKIEQRFDYQMTGGQPYSIVVDIWGTQQDVLHSKPLYGHLFQGTTLRFHEFIDVPARLEDSRQAAAKADYAVVCVGTTNEIESEGFDRDHMDFQAGEYQLIETVLKANPKTIVVNFSGSPMNLTPFVNNVPAILQAWFPGQECGHALARVLSGRVNPSGRLPISWPRSVEDNPSFGNFPVDENLLLRYEEGLNVGYRYYDRDTAPTPLFPFGYGLSYTTFKVSDVKFEGPTEINSSEDTMQVSCIVRNTGHVAGKVAVQFYVEYPDITIGRKRPIKELKAFAKTAILQPGATKQVSVTLDKYAVSFYDAKERCWRAVPGLYNVVAGQSSVNIEGSVEFRVGGLGFTWNGL